MISDLAVVETDAVGADVELAEFCVIREGAVIGDRVRIHPHVVIERGVTIHDDVEVFPGSYIGKVPRKVGVMLGPLRYESNVSIGKGCSIGPHAVIYVDVEIGDDTLIGDGASIRERCRIGSHCVIGRYVSINYATIIGDGVKVIDNSWLAGNMRVGDGVFISGGVTTANDSYMGIKGYSEAIIVGPDIRKGARIGVGAILLPGVVIGENAWVAAGAVVTKDVLPSQTVLGIPAKPRENPRE
jgi:acetyltransferase-like isoleucine patch superfamily enzyme